MSKQPKAIARIAKLHRNDLSGSGSHTLRQRQTPNADSDRQNLRLLGPDDPNVKLQDLVMAKIAEHPQQRKIRTDAVYCVEVLLSASPEYFRPAQPEQYGDYEPERLQAWVDASMQWLQKRYKNRLVLAELHLDESTPHIEAYLVPLDEDEQLNCRSLFGGREKMSEFQNSYAAAMAPLEIARGIPGSRADHHKIKRFYENINRSETLDAELTIDQLKAKAADRDRAVEDKEAMEETAEILVQQNQKLEEQAKTLQVAVTGNQELLNQNNQLQHRVQELERLLHGFENTEPQLKLEAPQNELLPQRDDNQWEPTRTHLNQEYKIPDWMIQELHRKDLLYADDKGRAVFVKRTPTGKPQHGLVINGDTTITDLVPDSDAPPTDAFWMLVGGDECQRAVIVEDPLEALAIAALDEQNEAAEPTLYVSAACIEQLPLYSLLFANRVYVSTRCEASFRELLQQSALNTVEVDPHHTDGWIGVLRDQLDQVQEINDLSEPSLRIQAQQWQV